MVIIMMTMIDAILMTVMLSLRVVMVIIIISIIRVVMPSVFSRTEGRNGRATMHETRPAQDCDILANDRQDPTD
jgi:hypothetical protein